MMNKRILFILTAILVLQSCNPNKKKQPAELDCLKINADGSVQIDVDKILKSNHKLSKIVIKNNSQKQVINLDTSHRVNAIQSFIKPINDEKFYLNNWLAVNYDGNLDIENSNFYESLIWVEQNEYYAQIRYQTSQFQKNKTFLIYGDIAEDFSVRGKIDTVFFKERLAVFKLENLKKGRNLKRFVLVDEDAQQPSKKRIIRPIYGTLRFDI